MIGRRVLGGKEIFRGACTFLVEAASNSTKNDSNCYFFLSRMLVFEGTEQSIIDIDDQKYLFGLESW